MFLTIEHVPRITDFCSCIYVLGCKVSLVRLCDSDFGITPVDDITIGITCAAFCFDYCYCYYYYYVGLWETFIGWHSTYKSA